MKRTTLFIIGMLFLGSAWAQNDVQMGIVDFDAALERHPDYQLNKGKMDALQTDMEGDIDTLSQNFNTKLQAFQAKYFELSDTDKETAEAELATLDKSLTEARQKYATTMQEAEKSLMAPLQTAVQDAISLAASQAGYNFVTSADLFYVADSSRDITPAVIALLNK
jgi:Skp family chaperone for outer membrane proteins